MENFLRNKDRDTILFVNEIPSNQVDWVIEGVKEVEVRLNRKLKVLIVTDKRDKVVADMKLPKNYEQIFVNTSSILQLEKALLPYLDKLVAAVCRGERNIPYFKNIIPHIPYIRTPSEQSLDWTINKISMRRRLSAFNKKLSPEYTIAKDLSRETIDKIKKKVGYPCVVKPATLAASALVTACYHEEDLVKSLKAIFRKMEKVHKTRGYKADDSVLVEEFMEGTMFSIDVYVSSRGTTYTTPMVHVVTGFSAGFGDFFGYKQMTPVTLKPETRAKAKAVAQEAVAALGARSITAHVELMKSPQGWKVIEVGPRVGGFRDFLYHESFGFDHAANDILIRLPMKPKISFRAQGFSAVMKIYPKEEGIIGKIEGIKIVQNLDSYKKIEIRLSKGDMTTFARHGGPSVLDIYLFNKERSDLLADMRRIEQKLHIRTSKSQSFIATIPSDITDRVSEDIVISK